MRGGFSRWSWRWLAATLIGLGVVAPADLARAQGNHKQVLALYSTRRDAQFAIIGESELPRTLDVGLGVGNLDYYSEFIDVATFPDPTYKVAFRDFLRVKYHDVKFDLVIAMQSEAIEFLEIQRNGLFRDTPAVFLSNDPARQRVQNSTGLIQERDFLGTVTLLRQLQPDVTQVFVVSGAGVSDKALARNVRNQLESSGTRLAFTFLSGLATKDLESRLSQLPEHSAVYYVIVSEDGAGNKFHPLDYVDRVAAAANAPAYSWVDSTMGRGILGGSLYRQRSAIARVGQLAVRVLRGEAADSIPVSVLHVNASQVDWRQLRRWGIPETRVPHGTLVSFRNPTVWEEYKAYILGTAGLLLTLTALITGLLIQRSRRRRAEELLQGSQRDLLTTYERNRDLSARLLRAQEAERARIARELHDDVCQRMALLTIELQSLAGAGTTYDTTPAAEAVSMAQGISKSLHELSHQLHPARLTLLGLVPALEQLRLELSRGGIIISFTHDAVPSTLQPEVMLCLFRVVQEALQNAIKYSNAQEVSVHVSNGPGGLTVSVADNGRGFDVNGAWTKGLGLASMAERLDAIGGSLEIRSGPGLGTRVMATVPLDSTESHHQQCHAYS
jgi:signal transduction histidine kinase